jgi:microcystin-dependent protein
MSNKPILSTQADLASSQTAGAPALVMPTGVVLPFAGTAAPTGWLACDGTAISRTTYASLFAAVSTSYGVGDGSTTFNLPDFRGRFPRFNDAMFGGSAAGRDSGRVLGSAQSDGNKSHAHRYNVGNGAGGAPNPLFLMFHGSQPGGGPNSDAVVVSNTQVGSYNGFGVTPPSANISINSDGISETRPINLSINAIIKV